MLNEYWCFIDRLGSTEIQTQAPDLWETWNELSCETLPHLGSVVSTLSNVVSPRWSVSSTIEYIFLGILDANKKQATNLL